MRYKLLHSSHDEYYSELPTKFVIKNFHQDYVKCPLTGSTLLQEYYDWRGAWIAAQVFSADSAGFLLLPELLHRV